MNLPKMMLESGIFWEYDPKTMDIEDHRALIIRRVLEFGDLEHIRWMFGQYGRDVVQEVFESGAPLSKKSENFWQKYFKSKVCMRKQSIQKQSMFLNR